MEREIVKTGTPIGDKVIAIVSLISLFAFKTISISCYAAGYVFALFCKLISLAIMLPIYVFRFLCGAIVLYFGLMAFLFIGKLVLFFLF